MLKTFVHALFFVLAASLACAQVPFNVVKPPSISGLPGSTLHFPITITNTSQEPIWLSVERTSQQLSEGHSYRFCIDKACQGDHKDLTLRFAQLQPGQGYTGFITELRSGIAESVSNVNLRFFVDDQPTLFRDVALTYIIGNPLSNKLLYSNSNLKVRDIYPNPANNEAVFEYQVLSTDFSARISLHNILGTEFDTYTLDPSLSKLKIRTDHLSPGIYFYTLYINNENQVTKKLVVKR